MNLLFDYFNGKTSISRTKPTSLFGLLLCVYLLFGEQIGVPAETLAEYREPLLIALLGILNGSNYFQREAVRKVERQLKDTSSSNPQQ